MKIVQIRREVFETNSSSTHSVSISNNPIFVEPIIREDTIELLPGEFGWEINVYYYWKDKASYALTYALGLGDAEASREHVEMLINVIEQHTGKKVYINEDEGKGNIDHQSWDTASLIFVDEDTLKRFIFGRESYLETDHDNH